ncbi:hypothetical protein HCU40_25665 [Pseudanabaena biceps]|nr:hypothetical protein [Pseudanabaena biceps]
MPPVTHQVITPDQEKGIIALVNEPTIAKAAEAINVNVTTMYRWMREPAFIDAYREARRESFKHAIALTQRYAPAAVQTLMKIMQDPAAGHAAKVSAATAMLKFSRESIELDDLAERIEKLESITAQESTPKLGMVG